MRIALPILLASLAAAPAHAADLMVEQGVGDQAFVDDATYRGAVTVLDGRTLEFFPDGPTVRLADVDTCALPQWAFERSGYPYPCGPLGKAWLMRLVRRDTLTCRIVGTDHDGTPLGRCSVRGGDLGYNVLRVGIGQTPKGYAPPNGCYDCAEAQALRNGWGLNGTVYLDPSDWRRRAEDRSLARRPFRDRNMIRDGLGTVYEPVAPRNPAVE